MEENIKTLEALITEIRFEPRMYKKYRSNKRAKSSDYYKDGIYYSYRAGFFTEYRPAKLFITVNFNEKEIIFDISEEIRDLLGGALKKDVVDALMATLPERLILNDDGKMAEEFLKNWINDANELRRAV